MTDFTKEKCVPCEGGVTPYNKEEAEKTLQDISGFVLSDDFKHIIKTFEFNNFNEAIYFVNQVAQLADAENHHPDMNIQWNKVTLNLSTHAIDGLSKNDFILAAKINLIQ